MDIKEIIMCKELTVEKGRRGVFCGESLSSLWHILGLGSFSGGLGSFWVFWGVLLEFVIFVTDNVRL